VRPSHRVGGGLDLKTMAVPHPTQRRGVQCESAVCYLLVSQDERRTYIGATVNFERRLRQHNGILAGGAKATHAGRPWSPAATLSGLRSWKHALQVEYRWKHARKVGARRTTVTRGLTARIARAHELAAVDPDLSVQVALRAASTALLQVQELKDTPPFPVARQSDGPKAQQAGQGSSV